MSKEYDKGQMELSKSMIEYWTNQFEYLEKAVNNGRCKECKDPLMFDEKEICEDCLTVV